VELLRSLGLTYKELEKIGFTLPVVNLSINYKKPAYYDDELTIRTTIKELPSSKITFYYEMVNENNEMLNIGEVVLVFVNKETGKPCFAPELVINKFKEKLV
jgi:acyl-CoA thioester hydrolase